MKNMNDNMEYKIGETLGTGLVYAAAAGVVYGAVKLWNNYWAKEETKERDEEIKIWNNGVCPSCGRKWHAHAFYPQYSGGNYQHVEIKCKNCKTKAVLKNYKPITTDKDYIIIK